MEEEYSFEIVVLIFLTNLALYILASYFIEKFKVSFWHQSTIAIVLGLLTSLLLKYGFGKEIRFSNEYFFALLLPPIVFSIGYGIKKPYFFENIGIITFIGILTTILTIFLFALILLSLNSFFKGFLSSKDILLLSVVLSSIDPISTIPAIKNNYPSLTAIISGENVLNSAVVIILFGTIMKINQTTQQYTWSLITSIVVNFTYLFLFSLLLGIVFGLGLSFIIKKIGAERHQPIKQSSLILLTSYVVYLLGEFIGVSGIIALFTSAIIFSIYGFQNLSAQAKSGTQLAFQTVRYISQAFIFTYLGACLISTQGKTESIWLSIVILLSIPIIRFLGVIFIPLLFKIARKNFPLSNPQIKILWYSGLTRGVISFALSLQIQSNNRDYLVFTSLIVVMMTTIITATFLKSFSSRVGLSQIGFIMVGENKEAERQIEMMPSTKYTIIGQPEQNKSGKVNKQGFKTFEQKFIKPLFLKNADEDSHKNMKIIIQT